MTKLDIRNAQKTLKDYESRVAGHNYVQNEGGDGNWSDLAKNEEELKATVVCNTINDHGFAAYRNVIYSVADFESMKARWNAEATRNSDKSLRETELATGIDFYILKNIKRQIG